MSLTLSEVETRRILASCSLTALRKRPGVTPVMRRNVRRKWNLLTMAVWASSSSVRGSEYLSRMVFTAHWITCSMTLPLWNVSRTEILCERDVSRVEFAADGSHRRCRGVLRRKWKLKPAGRCTVLRPARVGEPGGDLEPLLRPHGGSPLVLSARSLPGGVGYLARRVADGTCPCLLRSCGSAGVAKRTVRWHWSDFASFPSRVAGVMARNARGVRGTVAAVPRVE